MIAFAFISLVSLAITASDAQTTNQTSIISICAGGEFACAVFDDKRVKCFGHLPSWGMPFDYGYGDAPDELGNNLPFVNVADTPSVVDVSCGWHHVCFKLEEGDVKCLGFNDYGQVGVGLKTFLIGQFSGHVGDSLPSVNFGNGLKANDISVGSYFSCAVIQGANKAKCFGWNFFGQLGLGNSTNRGGSLNDMGDNLPFVDLGVGVEIASLHSGALSYHSCAILSQPATAAQRIKCWGEGASYKLGYNDQNNRGDNSGEMGENLPLVDLGSESRVKQVSLGYLHTCALLITNAFKCWGSNLYGQVAGSQVLYTTSKTNPISIINGKAVDQISSGGLHTCTVLDDGITIKCFGGNTNGQLGQGDTLVRGNSPDTLPIKIPPIQLGTGSLKIKSIASGYAFTCIFFENSSLKCFGSNNRGQCAVGSNVDIGTKVGDMGSKLKYAVIASTPTVPSLSPIQAPSTPTGVSQPTMPTFSPTSQPGIQEPTAMPTMTPSSNPINLATQSPTQSPQISPKCEIAFASGPFNIKDLNGKYSVLGSPPYSVNGALVTSTNQVIGKYTYEYQPSGAVNVDFTITSNGWSVHLNTTDESSKSVYISASTENPGANYASWTYSFNVQSGATYVKAMLTPSGCNFNEICSPIYVALRTTVCYSTRTVPPTSTNRPSASKSPSSKPTKKPAIAPTKRPVQSPTIKPTRNPVLPPTKRPSRAPTSRSIIG